MIDLLILLGSVFVPSFIVISMLFVHRTWRRRDKRRSPLTNKVLNFPGEQLRREVARHDEGFHEAAAMTIVIGPVVFAAWLLGRVGSIDVSRLRFGWGDAVLGIIGALMLAYCLRQLIHHGGLRRRYLQALEAELAVGQSLSRIQSLGALVFHDFPAGKFNIDHIVIGRSVVFAVETKSRKKPPTTGKDSAQVVYDGETLTYPGGIRESKPIEQARLQAEWLAKFLSSGVGEPVRVIAVLALPGWFTPPTAVKPAVLVNNCTNAAFMMSDRFGQVIPESMRTRIAHVLTEKYPELQVDPLKAP